MIVYINSAEAVADAPDVLVFGAWLAIGLLGFILGGVVVAVSLRRVRRRQPAMQADVAAVPSELIAA